jgi:hypothetical protein
MAIAGIVLAITMAPGSKFLIGSCRRVSGNTASKRSDHIVTRSIECITLTVITIAEGISVLTITGRKSGKRNVDMIGKSGRMIVEGIERSGRMRNATESMAVMAVIDLV